VRSPRGAWIGLIDEYELRLTSNLMLLEAHFNSIRPFLSADQFLESLAKDGGVPHCAIFNVGAASVDHPPSSEQLTRLTQAPVAIPVIVMSDLEEAQETIAALRVGVRGYIPTTLEPRLVVQAIRMVLAGGTFVPANALLRQRPGNLVSIGSTPVGERLEENCQNVWPPRQFAVLRLLAHGLANRAIAVSLSMEESTVKSYVGLIMRRLGVSNRTQAALYARGLKTALPGIQTGK